jgi:hypothetical protein
MIGAPAASQACLAASERVRASFGKGFIRALG